MKVGFIGLGRMGQGMARNLASNCSTQSRQRLHEQRAPAEMLSKPMAVTAKES
jgi:3-hydroxyisobutyrate dehydrogenase-like beta-hydroxyacid dehydrogenase